MDEKEIIMSCLGRNKNGEANVSVSSTLLSFNGVEGADYDDPNLYNEISTRYTRSGEFNFEVHNGIAEIELTFVSHLNPELRHIWEQLKEFGDIQTELFFDEQKSLDRINLVFNFSPDAYAREYIISAVNPFMWVLQPESPEREVNNVLHLYFKLDDIEINEIPNDIDLDQYEAASSRVYEVIYTEKQH